MIRLNVDGPIVRLARRTSVRSSTTILLRQAEVNLVPPVVWNRQQLSRTPLTTCSHADNSRGRSPPRARRGLKTVCLEWPAAQITLLDLEGVIDVLVHRREHLEREIVAILPGSPWGTQVGRLRCLRGVDTLTAVGLCAEIGDFERFATAGQLMSYLGLVPSEATTGNSRRLGSITKTGSAHARRLLVEAAWHYRKAPAIGKTLTDRQADQPAEAIAWTAQRRLHRTWTRLEARSKRRTLVAVAAARELVGFCWAIAQIE